MLVLISRRCERADRVMSMWIELSLIVYSLKSLIKKKLALETSGHASMHHLQSSFQIFSIAGPFGSKLKKIYNIVNKDLLDRNFFSKSDFIWWWWLGAGYWPIFDFLKQKFNLDLLSWETRPQNVGLELVVERVSEFSGTRPKPEFFWATQTRPY